MKKSFTMIELVFVIVVIGILATVVIPDIKSNTLREAATQLVSHIRYTQHLAMIDDKFDDTKSQWYREKWQIFFSTSNSVKSYIVFSEILSNAGAYDGNPYANNTYSKVEVAVDPLNRNRYLIGTTYSSFNNSSSSRINNDLDLTNKYGITDFKVTGGTSSTSKRILFDHLGRPYKGTTSSTSAASLSSPTDKLAISTIVIKLCIDTCIGDNKTTNNDKEIIILVEPETGYCRIG